jgi:hypothetical protein
MAMMCSTAGFSAICLFHHLLVFLRFNKVCRLALIANNLIMYQEVAMKSIQQLYISAAMSGEYAHRQQLSKLPSTKCDRHQHLIRCVFIFRRDHSEEPCVSVKNICIPEAAHEKRKDTLTTFFVTVVQRTG